MRYRLQKEIDKLKKNILTLGALVEERLNNAVSAVTEKNSTLSKQIIESDYEIDDMEVDLEEECLKLLALHQPVAIDLRFLVATMKINNDLERIGDLVVNICERGAEINSFPNTNVPFNLSVMSLQVKKMMKMSLDSLVKLDPNLARKVCSMDDTVDEMNRTMFQVAETELSNCKDQRRIHNLLNMMAISRHLERIADLTTNISEDVIYMTEGRIVRHKPEEFASKE